MVDLYSDRADAHASFFLAFLFGLFTVLAIAQYANANKWVWAVPFWLLFLGGFHSFLNFRFFATLAQKITEEVSCYEVNGVKKGEDKVKGDPVLGPFQFYKHWMGNQNILPKAMTVAYFAIAFLCCWLGIGCGGAIVGFISISVSTLVVYSSIQREWKEKQKEKET